MDERIMSDGEIESYFHSEYYLGHTVSVLKHLKNLNLPVEGKTVMDIGAGIGDHSRYYSDKGCRVTVAECRESTLRYLRTHCPEYNTVFLDMENPVETGHYDIIHCCGLLYHLSNPEQAIEYFGNHCDMKFLETCVSFGDDEQVNPVAEDKSNPTQSFSGTGCRPTRSWVFKQLKNRFPFTYIPKTQPTNNEFPIDWNTKNHNGLARAIFIASKQELRNDGLTTELLENQIR
jgi:hypothetical protein